MSRSKGKRSYKDDLEEVWRRGEKQRIEPEPANLVKTLDALAEELLEPNGRAKSLLMLERWHAYKMREAQREWLLEAAVTQLEAEIQIEWRKRERGLSAAFEEQSETVFDNEYRREAERRKNLWSSRNKWALDENEWLADPILQSRLAAGDPREVLLAEQKQLSDAIIARGDELSKAREQDFAIARDVFKKATKLWENASCEAVAAAEVGEWRLVAKIFKLEPSLDRICYHVAARMQIPSTNLKTAVKVLKTRYQLRRKANNLVFDAHGWKRSFYDFRHEARRPRDLVIEVAAQRVFNPNPSPKIGEERFWEKGQRKTVPDSRYWRRRKSEGSVTQISPLPNEFPLTHACLRPDNQLTLKIIIGLKGSDLRTAGDLRRVPDSELLILRGVSVGKLRRLRDEIGESVF